MGFGLKLTHQVELNLPSCDQVLLTAAEQTVEEQIEETQRTVLSKLDKVVEEGREDYAAFMARVDPKEPQR